MTAETGAISKRLQSLNTQWSKSIINIVHLARD